MIVAHPRSGGQLVFAGLLLCLLVMLWLRAADLLYALFYGLLPFPGYDQILAQLLTTLEERGIRKVMAVIGDSANAGSIGVHRALGFSHVGTVKACGWKFGRWLDIVLMERALGDADQTPPVET